MTLRQKNLSVLRKAKNAAISFGFSVSDSVRRFKKLSHFSEMEPRKTKADKFLGSLKSPMKHYLKPIPSAELSPQTVHLFLELYFYHPDRHKK